MKSLASCLLSLVVLTSASYAKEITLTPKDGQGETIVINTSKESELTLEGKTYLVQPKKEPATIAKAKAIVIPRLDLADVPLDEAIEYLTQKSIELDPAKDEPNGLNFVLIGVDGAVIPQLRLRNVSIFEIVGFISELNNTQVEFRESAIVFTKK